jgi:hypothetical protein
VKDACFVDFHAVAPVRIFQLNETTRELGEFVKLVKKL